MQTCYLLLRLRNEVINLFWLPFICRIVPCDHLLFAVVMCVYECVQIVFTYDLGRFYFQQKLAFCVLCASLFLFNKMFAFYQFHGWNAWKISAQTSFGKFWIHFSYHFIPFYWRWVRGKFVSLYKFRKLVHDMHGGKFSMKSISAFWCRCCLFTTLLPFTCHCR